MKKIVAVNFIFLLLATTQCTRDEKSGTQNEDRRILRWGVAKLPDRLDWNHCRNQLCRQQASLVMEGLTRLSVADHSLTVVPALAESWEFSPGGDLKITLRKNIVWTDGTRLTSDHFLKAWARTRSPLLDPILNMKSFRAKRHGFARVGATAPTPHTLHLRFHTPQPHFAAVLASPETFPWAGLEKKEIPASLGPYLIEESTPHRMVFTRNPTYFARANTVNKIEMVRFETLEEAVEGYRHGRVDFIDENFSSESRPIAAGSPPLTYFPTRSLLLLTFSTARPFHMLAARKAFSLATDPNELKTILKLEGTPHRRLFSFREATETTTAPEKGRQLLKTVLLKDDLSLALQIEKDEELKPIALNLQAQWLKNLGRKVEITNRPGDLKLVRWEWNPRRADFGVDPAWTRPLDRARQTKQWPETVFDWEQTLSEKEVAILPLLVENRGVLLNSRIQGLVLNPIDLWDFRNVQLNG